MSKFTSTLSDEQELNISKSKSNSVNKSHSTVINLINHNTSIRYVAMIEKLNTALILTVHGHLLQVKGVNQKSHSRIFQEHHTHLQVLKESCVNIHKAFVRNA